ncbi:MAG: tripartite tricarboxylate transporter substrate binding protein [Pseudomonadota bacterium]
MQARHDLFLRRKLGFASVAAVAAACLFITAPSHAADKFPSKAVRIVVPSPPGGSNDQMARLLALRLQERWGQPVVVEYKGGGGQTIGTDFVAKSPADGHTIGLVVTSHVINPALRKLPYDTLNDFSGVTLIGFTPILITTAGNAPFNNLADVLAHAKAHPGDITYATPGAGSSMHFAGDFLAKSAGVEFRHIPFRGGGQQGQEVMTGRVTLNIGTLGTSYPFVKSGHLKAIAITDPKRSPAAPEIPAVAETLPGFSVQSFIGFVVPKGTPRDVIQNIRNDVVATLKVPEVVANLTSGGFEVVGGTPEEFDRFIAEQVPRWAGIAKRTGITAE